MSTSTATIAPSLPDATTPTPTAVDWHLGSLMIWHLTAADTGGMLSLGEVVVPAGAEPPVHLHAREDETWVVLEGSVLFQRGVERIHATAGTTVFLPRGVPHGFAVLGETARMLHAYTPGGIDAAFRALSTPAPACELPPPTTAPPDPEVLAQLERVYGEYGVTFVGPPLRG